MNNLKYIFLTKINLSIHLLSEIINNDIIRLVINDCSNNNISLYDENEYVAKINKNINNCKLVKHIEFCKNDFSDNFINKIIQNLINLFFNKNNCVYTISCGFIREFDFRDIYNLLNDNSNFFIDRPRYLKIKFNSCFSYLINRNKKLIEVSNYVNINDINSIKNIYYEKIKLCLYSTDNPSISNNIKKVMENYYKKDCTKSLEIFASFDNGELNKSINLNNEYSSIEKFTLFFSNDYNGYTLFGNKIILSILIFFPNIKVISFKNVNFQNDDKKFRENYDDLKTCFELILFGEKNEILSFYKSKKIHLEEIKFSNCYYYQHSIKQYILDEINGSIYFNKKIKLTFAEYY